MLKRPMLFITVCYIIGIILGLYLRLNIALFVLLVLSLISIIIFILLRYKSVLIKSKEVLLIGIICIITLNISSIRTSYLENRFNRLYSDYYKQNTIDVNYKAHVVSVEKESQYYYNYIVKIINIDDNVKYKNTHILLKVKKSKNNVIRIEYGDIITGKMSLERPETQRNYGGFDYSRYLKTKNVYMIGKSNVDDIKVSNKHSEFVIKVWINSLRERGKDNLKQLLSHDNSNIANALLLGYSNLVDSEQKEQFSNASLSHILAISGMHVGFVFAGITIILKRFDNRKGKYVGIVFLLLFGEFAGSSPSVIRAVIMMCLIIFSKLFYRKSDSLNNIAISALIILTFNPYNLFNQGFQLSFLGTLSIVLFYTKLEKFTRNVTNSIMSRYKIKKRNMAVLIAKKAYSIIIVSISANILIFPLLVYSYNMVSFVFLISNILVSPLLFSMSLIGYIVILVSFISIKIALPFAFILNLIINVFSQIANFCSNITWLRWRVATPNLIYIAIYYIAVFYFRFFYSAKHRSILLKLISIITIIIVSFNLLAQWNSGFKLYFIDIGQGDSSLIITGNKTILIDGGGSEASDYDVGKNVLLPYLLDRGVNKIDYMVFSHFDSDHCKGLFTIMENMKVQNAIISAQGKESDNYKCFIEIAKRKKIKIICVKAGDMISVDKYTNIQILWPEKTMVKENILNNNSIVCKVNYNKKSILFTGDIEEIAEKRIIEKYGNNAASTLKSDVLKVAHHGSKTSSIGEIVKIVNPRIALIGVGKNNKFGHPNGDVIDRIKKNDSEIFRTDENGEISVYISKKGTIKVKKFIHDR